MKFDSFQTGNALVPDDTDQLQAFFDQFSGRRTGEGFSLAPGAGVSANSFCKIDLCGRKFLVRRSIRLRQIHGAVVTNGVIEAAPSFPEGSYLFEILGANTLKLENLGFECAGRASGIYAHSFLRLRIEDCTILHQLNYGIFASDKGNNHELEVIKCNIIEFLWGDGSRDSPDGTVPAFRLAANRKSTGIFLGQADNVVADCNINLCRVGIEVGMRANRIQGNHITAGGTAGNEIFDGIVLRSHVKSSALIVNNYIDNCRLVIFIDDKPVNRRNYATITDNLFYRGFNHPGEGCEFNHIVIRPLAPNSILENVIICDNQFYTQDEHLAPEAIRVIRPVAVDPGIDTAGQPIGSIDPDRVRGAIMRHNVFTNAPPYFEIPVGSHLSGTIPSTATATSFFSLDFAPHLAWGHLVSAQVTMIDAFSAEDVAPFSVRIKGSEVQIMTPRPVRAGFKVEVDVNNPYGGRGGKVVAT